MECYCEFGDVLQVAACRLACNRSGTKVAYFAMVTMGSVEEASKCIRTLHDYHFRGSKLTVKKVKKNKKNTGFSGLITRLDKVAPVSSVLLAATVRRPEL